MLLSEPRVQGKRNAWTHGLRKSYRAESGRVDAEQNLLLVKGAVPGPKKALVTIKETTRMDA